jgi:hypothetical protein
MTTTPRPPSPRPRDVGGLGPLIGDQLAAEYAAGLGPKGPRHRLSPGYDTPTEEIPVTHADTPEGRSDDFTACDGEDRRDPNSWDDPDILDEPWRAPEFIEPLDTHIIAEEG